MAQQPFCPFKASPMPPFWSTAICPKKQMPIQTSGPYKGAPRHILGQLPFGSTTICPNCQMSQPPFVTRQVAWPPFVLTTIWGNSHLSLTAIWQPPFVGRQKSTRQVVNHHLRQSPNKVPIVSLPNSDRYRGLLCDQHELFRREEKQFKSYGDAQLLLSPRSCLGSQQNNEIFEFEFLI